MSNAFGCILRKPDDGGGGRDIAWLGPLCSHGVQQARPHDAGQPAALERVEDRFKTFWSKTGVRQGDPLGPLLYTLTAVSAMMEVQEY
jgi:hypothetical protein